MVPSGPTHQKRTAAPPLPGLQPLPLASVRPVHGPEFLLQGPVQPRHALEFLPRTRVRSVRTLEFRRTPLSSPCAARAARARP